jgi:hypothetical protein
MKSFSLLKIVVTALGFGAVLLFTPSCRAQSEINPDHFDGTDSWETAARTPAPHALHSPASENQLAPNNQLAKTKPASASSTLQLASDRNRTAPQRRDAAAIPDKRKPTVRKPEKP